MGGKIAWLVLSQGNNESRAIDHAVDASCTTDKKDALHVTDKRTGQSHGIPITNNSVRALDFKILNVPEAKVQGNLADELEGSLRILDPGYQNTAVKESNITFV